MMPASLRKVVISTITPNATKMSSPKKRPTVSVAAENARSLSAQVADLAEAGFGCAFGHRRDERTHHLRMPAETGQADHRGELAHEQIDDQKTPGRGGADAADPRLRALAQAVPFEQPDYRRAAEE